MLPKILVPVAPGVTSALGLLMADFRHDMSCTYLCSVAQVDLGDLNNAFGRMEQAGLEQMAREGVDSEKVLFFRTADMRYMGQGYELEVSVPGGKMDSSHLATVNQRFHESHQRAYGYANWEEETELVTLRVVAIGQLRKPELGVGEPDPTATVNPESARKGERPVYFAGGWVQTPIYERSRLRVGDRVLGPSIIEQFDSTTVMLSGQQATVDTQFNLVIEKARE
jgi:N-methylhydantoinase A